MAAFKKSEKNPKVFVVRMAEVLGESCVAKLVSNLHENFENARISGVTLCNSLEHPIPDPQNLLSFDAESQTILLQFAPLKIQSILVHF